MAGSSASPALVCFLPRHPALCCPHRVVLQLFDFPVTTCCNNGLHVWRHGHTTAAQEGTQTGMTPTSHCAVPPVSTVLKTARDRCLHVHAAGRLRRQVLLLLRHHSRHYLYWHPLSTFSFSLRRSDSRHSYTAPSAPADTTRLSLLAQHMARIYGAQTKDWSMHVADSASSPGIQPESDCRPWAGSGMANQRCHSAVLRRCIYTCPPCHCAPSGCPHTRRCRCCRWTA